MFIAVILTASAYAADDENYYIFQINRKAETKRAPVDADPVYAETGLYRTNDLSLIRDFEKRGILIDYTLDAEVYLFGLQEDIESLRSEDWSGAMLGKGYAVSGELSGEGVRIAMIDSGIRPDYAELTGSTVVQGVNYLAASDSEERSDTKDTVGHGTFVASVMTSDMIGLAPKAELVPLKCFDSNKSSVSYIVSAIYAAVDDFHCNVINLSLGTTTDVSFLQTAISYAYENGAIVIAASGNLSTGTLSTGNDPLYYPAAYDEVIGVGAVNAKKQISSYSVQNQSVTLVAPGDGVSGLSHTGTDYISGVGTSYASPFVAAAAALALEADSELSPQQFLSILQMTSEDLGADGRDNTYGYGLLNLGLLLAKLRNDGESLILTLYDGRACISAYQAEPERECQMLAAFYDSDGRLSSVAFIGNSSGNCSLNNYVLTDIPESLALYVMDSETFAPQTGVRRY